MKVEIRLRSDGERGLFATEIIKKGETICILPIDYIQLDEKWYSTNGEKGIADIDFRYGIRCEILHDPSKNEFQNIMSMFKEKKPICYMFYPKLELIGVSNPKKTEDIFIGHMINDYLDMSFVSENKYASASKEFSNVRVSSKLQIFETDQKRFGLKIKALKDINKGDELYLSYGADYWKKYSDKQKFIYRLNLLGFN